MVLLQSLRCLIEVSLHPFFNFMLHVKEKFRAVSEYCNLRVYAYVFHEVQLRKPVPRFA